MPKRRRDPEIPEYIKVMPKAVCLAVGGLLVMGAGCLFFTDKNIRDDPNRLGPGEIIFGLATLIAGLLMIALGVILDLKQAKVARLSFGIPQ